MEAKAQAKYNRQSARKVKKVLDLISGKNVESALNVLHFSPVKASKVIENIIRSAIANYLQTEEGRNVDPDSLIVKKAFVDEGPTMKRFRPASMGRASRIRKRMSHVTVIVSDQ